MKFQIARSRARSRFARWQSAAGWLCLVAFVLAPNLLFADTTIQTHTENALIVQSDHGGWLSVRSQQVRALDRSGRKVELRGECYSACTMYLGLENICIAPNAKFRFHGPSRRGAALPEASFEHWSEVMARSYREPIRSWFLQTARHRISGYYEISGAELIRLGYVSC